MTFATRVTARAWVLFGAMALLWGIPYLFIKEAVESLSPAAIVCGITLGGGLLLLPFALRARALAPAMRALPWVLAFGAIEMAGPFLLLGDAEQVLPSGVTGLLVSTVPLFAALIGLFGGDRGVLRPLRSGGLILGFIGVAVVVAGPEISITGADGLLAVAKVLLVGLLYAIAPFIIVTKLADIPPIGTITVALVAVGIGYVIPAVLTQHEVPTVRSLASLASLTVICTAVAFLVFFALIREAGPVRAPLFTYVCPVVAILLGATLRSEPIGPGLLLGVPLIIAGCWFAATGGVRRRSGADRTAAAAGSAQGRRS